MDNRLALILIISFLVLGYISGQIKTEEPIQNSSGVFDINDHKRGWIGKSG